MSDLLLAALVGGFISLDRTAFLQIMVSQPLVAGTLIGFALGDPVTGLIIGSVLELLWIGAVPVGSSVPPNETAAAVIAVTVGILASRHMGLVRPVPLPMIVFSMMISIPLAIAGQRVDIFVRGYNRRFAVNADRLLDAGDYMRIGRENLKGLLSFFVASFISLILLNASGLYLAEKAYPLIPDHFLRGFSMAFYLLVSLGIAVSIRTARGKRTVAVFSAGALLGFIIMYLRG